MSELQKRRVLIVEDEYLIAAALAEELTATGIEVVGPAATVSASLELIERHGTSLHAAVLDVNLRGTHSYPVADVLQTLRVPYVFTSGYDRSVVPVKHRSAPLYQKPLNFRLLAEWLGTAQ